MKTTAFPCARSFDRILQGYLICLRSFFSFSARMVTWEVEVVVVLSGCDCYITNAAWWVECGELGYYCCSMKSY